MRVLIAADSFKDALPASAVCAAIAMGLRERASTIEPIEFPLADGGDGMLDVLTRHLALNTVEVPTVDPLFRPINAPLGISRDGKLAVIEMAKASGIQLLNAAERNALLTTTLGTGKLVAAAIDRNVERIVLGIGGSATHDVGMGAASALGWRFLDGDHRALQPIGRELQSVAHIVPPAQAITPRIDVLCDVTNPLLGEFGAAKVYARQKGADEQTIERLERGSKHFAELVHAQVNTNIDFHIAGAGAAGGLGFGALAFLNASLQRGVETILDLTAFERALEAADLVITGEGKLDSQTLQGKLLAGVCARATARNIPVIALAGEIAATEQQLQSLGLQAAYCINSSQTSKNEMLANTAKNLSATAANLTLSIK